MAKKSKDDVPNPNSVANRDILQRLNFLYQSSVYLNSLTPPNSQDNAPHSESSKRKRKIRTETTKDLSRYFVDVMKVVGQKTTVKMDPSIKRTLCKGCNTILIPGSTTTVRVKKSPSHGHIMTYTCTSCNTSRRIPAPPTVPSPEGSEDASMQDPSQQKKPKRRRPTPRVPPLSARSSAGHVVFSGNEKVPEINGLEGSGIFIA